MFSELVDTLRCLEPHEESWLVAVAHRVAGRYIIEGTLGCPVCRARYPIVDGVAAFTRGETPPAAAAAPRAEGEPSEGEPGEDALKLAAMLDLTDPRGYALLVGEWGRLAPALRDAAPVSTIAVNAPVALDGVDRAAALRTIERVPVARGSARGLAIDAASRALLASALAAVRPGGRVVGEVALPVPDEVEELARDDRHWVGALRGSGGPLLQLSRNQG